MRISDWSSYVCSSDLAGEDGFESMRGENLSLHDHLTTQAGAAFKGPDLIIAAHLIDLIEETGYLTDSVDEVADRLGITPSEVAAVLTVIQGFDQSGDAARSLSECLAIQARDADRYDPAMALLLDTLALLTRGDLSSLRRNCGGDHADPTPLDPHHPDYKQKS